MESNTSAIWIARPPQSKASPPRLMSYSTLTEIEACPRRWWLRSASYPEIWDGRGYPDNPSLALLIGQVLHQCVEEIIKALKAANETIDDETFMMTMRSLGGYPAILEKESKKIIEKLETNPRVNHKLKELEEGLKTRMPQLRERLQIMITDLDFDGIDSNAIGATNERPANGHRKLQNGFYAEVGLIAEELKWYGKADYLKLSDDGCEIVDFKTGARKPEHELQLHIYNMLWTLDKDRNPDSIPISRLILAYRDGEKQVPPLASTELENFTKNIMRRTSAALEEISKAEPVAIPSLDNCCHCPVRQLCSVYWTEETQRFLNDEKSAQSLTKQRNSIDIEIELENSTADHIWHARAVIGGCIEPDSPLLVRFAPTALQFPIKFKAGQRLRLLNAHSIDDADEETSTTSVTTNWRNEFFLISK